MFCLGAGDRLRATVNGRRLASALCVEYIAFAGGMGERGRAR